MKGTKIAGVAAALAAAAALAGCSSSGASASAGITATCTLGQQGDVTVVFTNHGASDIEIFAFNIAYYNQSGAQTGLDPRAALVTVPAGQKYTNRAYAINDSDATTCKAVSLDTGTPS
jgi:ABC-type glycerol-3-phosphate transport system substrate-binding protein